MSTREAKFFECLWMVNGQRSTILIICHESVWSAATATSNSR